MVEFDLACEVIFLFDVPDIWVCISNSCGKDPDDRVVEFDLICCVNSELYVLPDFDLVNLVFEIMIHNLVLLNLIY